MTGKTQQRGRETRDRIVEAAIRILARAGAQAITHRAAAQEAGVSLALTTYHFASRDDILRQVYDRLYEGELQRFREIYRTARTEDHSETEIIDYVSTQVIREATEFREDSIAGFELLTEAFRRRELGEAALAVFDEKMQFWSKTMATMGSDDAELDAQLMLCTSLGSFLILMARGRLDSDLAATRRKIQYDVHSLFSAFPPVEGKG
ncbi:MAG TPA: TetR family transcriptional regulator [Sphingopyxis sp.]|nr:TetR family transcriptional regulator [Sphingopyxis sp.]HMP43836.1 TetR family transcriptional regulator [Sphingopyxis sp.]HMQ18331.1 TetR family transcriptional regulator [Sphingopyxis sp.]